MNNCALTPDVSDLVIFGCLHSSTVPPMTEDVVTMLQNHYPECSGRSRAAAGCRFIGQKWGHSNSNSWPVSMRNMIIKYHQPVCWKVSNHRWSRASDNAYHPFPFSDHKGYSPVLPVESASLVLYPARMMGTYADINGIGTTQNLGSNLYVLLCNWL